MHDRQKALAAMLALTMLVLLAIGACGATGPDTALPQDGDQGQEPGTLAPVPLDPGQKLRVVATTNILGDVVGNVGGERIALTTLMAPGVDPHTYMPTPADIAAIHDAHIVFANGAGLEADLEEVFANAGGQSAKVVLSRNLDLLSATDDKDGDHGGDDPHVWLDVQNVLHWVSTIEEALVSLDPAYAGFYQENAQAYARELQVLDAWVVEQVASIPESNRKLVTNHPAFGYMARRYGLEQLGAVYPVSPSSEPSAREIATLQDAIRRYGVPAVFTESTVNPKLAEQVAQDTGVRLVALYSGSLGVPGSGAETYIQLIRYDVNAIVDALK